MITLGLTKRFEFFKGQTIKNIYIDDALQIEFYSGDKFTVHSDPSVKELSLVLEDNNSFDSIIGGKLISGEKILNVHTNVWDTTILLIERNEKCIDIFYLIIKTDKGEVKVIARYYVDDPVKKLIEIGNSLFR